MVSSGCSMKDQMLVDLSVEELFINVASYAYAPGTGDAVIRVMTKENPRRISITISDRGMPYNPLEKEDPDVTLSAEERKIGGLGVFMVKKSVDDIHYEYKYGQNIVTIEKNL
jgi:anti-sigma regulatory factor (Ser/Thr protein kinase)